MLYQIHNGTIRLKGETILDHICFEIKGREKIGLVGENGAGKTTLLRLISGQLSLDREEPDSGIRLARNITVGMLPQDPWPDKEQTLEAEIRKLIEPLEPYSRERFAFVMEYDKILTGFGFAKEDKYKKIGEFSGGQQTRLAMIKLLLQQPDILLLDEPTNHLDAEGVHWLEEYLTDYPRAVLLVSHDRFFLDRTVHIIYEVSHGKLTRYPGNYSEYRRQREKKLQGEMKAWKAQQEEIERLTALIQRFRHKPRKASMTRAKKKQLERINRLTKPRWEDSYIYPQKIVPLRPGSKLVFECDRLGIGYRKELRQISCTIRRGQKVGILGKNGSGKSTFLKTLREEILPLRGSLRQGNHLDIAYYEQQTGNLPGNQRIIEFYQHSFPGKDTKEIKKILARYRFYARDLGKRIRELSGGEKSRLYLSILLESRPNVLLLDEPTNHMDIPSREVLESAFKEYEGTILFVTHDRYFLKEVATSLLLFDEEKVKLYPFPYLHYLEHCKKQLQLQESGLSAVESQNQALRRSLEKVPEKTRMQSARLSTEQAYADWQLTLASRELQEAGSRLEAIEAKKLQESLWMNGESWENLRLQREQACRDYTEHCICWYEKYLACEEAFKNYREE